MESIICLYVGLTSRHRDVPARHVVESKQLHGYMFICIGLTSRHRDVPARYAPPLVESKQLAICLYVGTEMCLQGIYVYM